MRPCSHMLSAPDEQEIAKLLHFLRGHPEKLTESGLGAVHRLVVDRSSMSKNKPGWSRPACQWLASRYVY